MSIFSDSRKYIEAIDKLEYDPYDTLEACEPRKKENKMNPTAKSLQEQIDNYYRQIDRLKANLDRLENLPEESPYDSVIYFQKNFGDGNGKVYIYVAVRVKHMSWEDLLEYVAKGESETPKIWIVTEWSDEL